MVKALVAGALVWPIALGAALAARVHGEAPIVTGVMYFAASRVCHQRPERSFHWHDIGWPVCGRCSGLYLGGAAGAVAAAWSLRRRRRATRVLTWLAAAAVPTAITIALEWTALAPVTNAARGLAALPLGALVAFVIVRTAAGPRGAIG